MRLATSHGMINLELRADLVPKTVHNFLLLCQRGYYTGTKFHRLIKGFMMQVPHPPPASRYCFPVLFPPPPVHTR